VRVRLGGDVAADPYARSHGTGAFILIDEATNDTVAAGMIR
jgi:sulfate adenylyltransferase subunit 1 (EFTu-like GTPase family)